MGRRRKVMIVKILTYFRLQKILHNGPYATKIEIVGGRKTQDVDLPPQVQQCVSACEKSSP